MSNKKNILQITVHVLFIAIFVAGVLFFYVVLGKKDVSHMVQSAENAYKDKPSVVNAVTENLNANRLNDEDIPYETVKYSYTWRIPVKGRVQNFRFKIPVPYNENQKQYILNNTFSLEPTEIHSDGVNTTAEFKFPELRDEVVKITISGEAKLRVYDLRTAKKLNTNIGVEKDLNRYLQPEKYVESDDASIKNIANKIKGETREELVKNIYLWVNGNIQYKIVPGILGAKKTVQNRYGKCSEFSALMVALCRAKGIPARIITGNMVNGYATKHSWVEVYFDEYGWVCFDPTRQPTVINIVENGKLVRQEKRIDWDNSAIQLLASVKNDLSPYYVSMSVSETSNGSAQIEENYSITK